MVDVETVDPYITKSEVEKSLPINGRQSAGQRVTDTLIDSHLFILDGIGYLPLCILDI